MQYRLTVENIKGVSKTLHSCIASVQSELMQKGLSLTGVRLDILRAIRSGSISWVTTEADERVRLRVEVSD